jgi:hypothetical protein
VVFSILIEAGKKEEVAVAAGESTTAAVHTSVRSIRKIH